MGRELKILALSYGSQVPTGDREFPQSQKEFPTCWLAEESVPPNGMLLHYVPNMMTSPGRDVNCAMMLHSNALALSANCMVFPWSSPKG